MKKLFTLVALLTCFMGAKAEVKTVVDFEKDYSTATSWEHGWLNEEEHIKFEDGCIHFHSDAALEAFYGYQYQLFPGVSGLDNDAYYTITLRIKGSVAQSIHASFSGSNTPGMIPITTDWVDVVLENCVNDPNAQYFANSGTLLIQPGDYVGDFWISYIKVTHEYDDGGVTQTWLQMLTDTGNPAAPEGDGKYVGDAETPWPAWALETIDGINANWRTDKAREICAWSLTMGKNFDDGFDSFQGEKPDRSRPYPTDIEVEEGNESNHVYAVHVDQIGCIDDCDTDDKASTAWSNQFWIQSPKEWKTGTKIHLKFRYKAQHGCKVGTQIHTVYPSKYKHWNAIGDITFSTEWQEFDKEITLDASQADPTADNPLGAASVAFNLCSDADNGRTPNVFYFDDLSWEVLKLDEGLFVAAADTRDGDPAYDLNAAAEFAQDPSDDEVVFAVVGKEGKSETWINELMISTVRGDKTAFNGATISPTGTITSGEWMNYQPKSSAKIKLPAAGVWKIEVAQETAEICFTQIEGEAAAEPVAIVTNATECVVHGAEREDLKDGIDNGVITVKEEADDPEGQTVGGEGHEGQPWDNQFWIAANRNLETGEVTVLKFWYKASKAAKTSTQAHKVGDDGKPCTYLNWQAIGDVNFTEEWQEFSTEFTVPEGDNGMRSFVFNMAEIKEACDYYIKDVQWYIKDAELEAEGKTMENLINGTGAENFWIKENKGVPESAATGISTIAVEKKASNIIYNLAGQRVSKDFKGIVIKNGKKVVNK